VRAGWAVRPRPAPRAGVVRPAAQGRLGDLAGVEDKGADTRAPSNRDREGWGGLRGVNGPKGRMGWAGWIRKEGRGSPVQDFGILEIKGIG
jgi:hypothetical protein